VKILVMYSYDDDDDDDDDDSVNEAFYTTIISTK
jgi:hypothetical protein